MVTAPKVQEIDLARLWPFPKTRWWSVLQENPATPPASTAIRSDNSTPHSGAAYVFTRSGTVWSQQAYLKASNNNKNGNSNSEFYHVDFGLSVDISGDTIVIGAPNEDSNATGVNGDQGR